MRNGAWLHHQELIKTTSSSSIPEALEGAARRSICAKCASSVHTIRSARSSSGLRIPDRLIDFRPAVYSAIFTVSNVNDS
jgi:hypothetical protein